MNTEAPNVIRMEVNLPDFERRIEEEFKPALRAAIEQVTCAFIAEIGGAVTEGSRRVIEHRAFFGDGEKTFALPTPMLEELQRTTGHGVGALFRRLQAHDFSLQEIAETIRLALIGGGTSPKEAAALVKTYVNERPLVEGFELASIVLGVRFFGNATVSDKPQDETGQAATTHPEAKFHVEKQPDGSTVGYFA